jgi:hypothetical protein
MSLFLKLMMFYAFALGVTFSSSLPPLTLSSSLLTPTPVKKSVSPQDTIIRPGVPVFDTDGNRLYAGGANIWFEQADSLYYLIGEGKKTLPGVCSDCFNLYSSPDLSAWTFQGCALKNSDVVAPQAGSPNYRIERPKIFRCPSNNRLTMWFHCDLIDFGMKSVGVLTADVITGPWTFAAPCFKPDGRDSYDMGTFIDNGPGGDGKGYLIRSVENRFAGISQMTDDCLNVTGIISSGPDMEGQALMRNTDGVLYAAGSHLTGWAPNAAQFVTTNQSTLIGAVWTNNYNPSNDPTTYDSQSTFIFPFVHEGGNRTTFMWMADRWNSGNAGPHGIDNMTMIWLPLIPPNSTSPSPPVVVGTPLFVDTCNSSSPLQLWNFVNGQLQLTAANLCVSSDAVFTDCSPTGQGDQWAGDVTKNTVTNGEKGSACLDLNVQDDVTHQPGNPVVPYQCTNPTSWNDVWTLPGISGGLIIAHDKSGVQSNLCLSATNSNGDKIWTLPYKSEWKLADY